MTAAFSQLLSKQDMASILECIHDSLECQREEQLKALIQGMHSLISFDFAVCSLGTLENGRLAGGCAVINISYPTEWLDLYLRNEFYLIDPIIKANFTDFGVQYWAETYQRYGCPRHFMALAEDFKLRKGYSCGLGATGTGSKGSLFSLAGDVENHPRSRLILETLVPHLHQALERVSAKCPRTMEAVFSKREEEILNWVKHGKSSWEISVILGISERTVKFHVSTVMRKLNAVSRSHAVAIAISLGLIAAD